MKKTLLSLILLFSISKTALLADPMLGEVKMFAGTFTPRGWAFCEGQLLPISKNSALFSLLGTTYGGDGRQTFALPDLRGRAAVHPGAIDLGSKEGALGAVNAGEPVKSATLEAGNPKTQASVRLHYIICIEGDYPSRN